MYGVRKAFMGNLILRVKHKGWLREKKTVGRGRSVGEGYFQAEWLVLLSSKY